MEHDQLLWFVPVVVLPRKVPEEETEETSLIEPTEITEEK